jgi:hypothetical protein
LAMLDVIGVMGALLQGNAAKSKHAARQRPNRPSALPAHSQ